MCHQILMTSKKPTPGSRLRSLRIASGMSQTEVALTVGVARNTLSAIESGSDYPGRETLIALADVFKASIDWIEGRMHKVDMPEIGKFVKDPDELALLALWNGMDDAKRDHLISILRLSPPDHRESA
jgi:putative transcriptional regulator